MYKKQLYHLWKRIRPIRTWYLLVAFAASAVVCVFALRNNNLTMVKLRDTVYQADKDGGDIEGALRNLRLYVYAHMNTDPASGTNAVYPPIQLKYTYQRLQQAEMAKVSGANAQVYTDAQHHCEELYPGSVSGGPRVPCIEAYVSSHGSGAKAKTIPGSLYKFNFVSPKWSPDFAGWSMVFSGVLLVLAAARFFLGRLLQLIVK